MLRRILLLIMLLTSITIFGDETKKRTVIKESDQHYGVLDYIDDYYTNDLLVRSELYFTQDYILQNGRINQIEFYNDLGKIIKYDSSFSKDYEKY